MKLLTPAQCPEAALLLQPLSYHLAVQAGLAGSPLAQVYADLAGSLPLAAVLTRKRLYLAGSPQSPAAREFISQTVIPRLLANGESWLVVYPSPAWEEPAAGLFPGKTVYRARRQHYRFLGPLPEAAAPLPRAARLETITPALLEQPDLENRDALRGEICSEGGALEDFFEDRFGVCLRFGSALAGWCLSEHDLPGRTEIGIEVVEAYQRRGYGTVLTTAFVRQAWQRGVTEIGWDCYADNLPSVATARKTGFGEPHDYIAQVIQLVEDQG